MDVIDVTIAEAGKMLPVIIKSGLVAMVKGSPGLGKSSIINAVAGEFGLMVIDLRLSQSDPTDLQGFPRINHETGKSGYAPMETFPLENDPIPTGYNGWMLFLDEANAADDGTLKASYKLIDRMVGQGKLHKNVAIVCAGNLDTDGALVEESSTAMQSRLVHLRVRSDLEGFVEHATNAGFDYRISSFLRFKPSLLNNFDPNKASLDETFACERTWEFASKLLKNLDTNSFMALPLLAGTIGQGVAREFLAFLKVFGDLHTVDEILADPDNISVPIEPSTLYAMTGACGQNITAANADKMMRYIQRFPMEFQVVTLREITRRHPTLRHGAAIAKWIQTNKKELVA
jgi:hypothetical protein